MDGVTVHDPDPMDGGASIETWMSLWNWSHEAGQAGPRFTAWPDGRALLDQPAIVVAMFGVIDRAMADCIARRQATDGVRK